MGSFPTGPAILNRMQIIPMSAEGWRLPRQAIADGDLLVFPTDTVYGVACDPHNPGAIERLFEAKGRDREKAIPLLLSHVQQVTAVSPELPEAAVRLGKAYWPGALTLVVPRSSDLPSNLSAGSTIAIR